MACCLKFVVTLGLTYLVIVRGEIVLKGNGYDGIVVAIDERVPEDETLLEKLKESLQEASEVLFQATGKQVYFRTILIQVPSTWISRTPKILEQHPYVRGDIIIDNPPKFHGETPFTMQPLGCGIPGDFTVLPPGFLTNTAQTNGPIAKVIVHEWAHLRFGLFDEYPVEDSQKYYSQPVDGKVVATRCSLSLQGEITKISGSNCLSPNDVCVYEDGQQSGSYASLMYKPSLEHVDQFCNNDTLDAHTYHNVDAPTDQNVLCDGKSAWEVLRDHHDFVNETSSHNIAPAIQFVEYKIQRERTVVVMDISGSMAGDKIAKMAQAVKRYLRNSVREGEEIGLVQFGSKATVSHELILVSSDAIRDRLAAVVPTSTDGATCIGCGIEAALKMLNSDPHTFPYKNGGTIIVMSDGEENRLPSISEMHNDVLNQEVTLHSIALTNAADSNVDALAIDSKGLTFLYSFDEESNALTEAFDTLSELHTDAYDKNIQLESKIYKVENGYKTNYIDIDKTIGRGTKFIFDYEGTSVQIIITSPNKIQYTEKDADHRDSHIYVFSFGDEIQIGQWKYSIYNPENNPTRVAVTITSKASNPEKPPIVAHPFWSHRDGLPRIGVKDYSVPVLFVRVSQGYSPVIGASVKAYVRIPDGSLIEPDLIDNGDGCDMHANDGIYCTEFNERKGTGRYSIFIVVHGKLTTTIDHRRIIGRGAPSNETEDDDSGQEATGSFSRASNAGAYNVATIPEKYAPGRIRSLSLVGVDPLKQILVITWLATGSELRFGTASHYDIRISTIHTDLRDDFESQTKLQQEDILLGQLNQPQTSGTLETFIVRFPNVETSTVYFAVVAYDNEGRLARSDVSNVISVLLTTPQFIPPTIIPVLNPLNNPAPAPAYQQPNNLQQPTTRRNDPQIPVNPSTPIPSNDTAPSSNTTTNAKQFTSPLVKQGPSATEQATMIGIPLLVVITIFSVVLYIMHIKHKRFISPKSDIVVRDTEEAIEEEDTKDDPQEEKSKSIPICVVEPDNGVDIGIVKVKPACVIAVDTDNDKAALKAKYVREAGDLGTHFQTPPAPTYLPKAKTLYKDYGDFIN